MSRRLCGHGKIKNTDIDLVFLDINMPRLSGINMVKSMNQLPQIIFTTAYPEYAVEGFELEVLDYLLKPVPFERFVKAIEKARKKLGNTSEGSASFIMIKSDKRHYKVAHADIAFIQSMGDFIKIYFADKVLISSETLKNIEGQLPAGQFLRIHKSYLVSLAAVRYLDGNQVVTDRGTLPIGLTFKEALMRALDLGNS
ncbi:MAG: response regulator transcription factor [Cyclobacteriaceae bacterium]|nr:response regulator transcription factor [Cyclobacteriaceae bacterium]